MKENIKYLNGYFDAFNYLKSQKRILQVTIYEGNLDSDKIDKVLALGGKIVSDIEKTVINKPSGGYLENWLKEALFKDIFCSCNVDTIEYSIFKIIDYIDIFVFDNEAFKINSYIEYQFGCKYEDKYLKALYKMRVLQISLQDKHLFIVDSLQVNGQEI